MRQLAWIYHADVLPDRPAREVRDLLERSLPGVAVQWVMPFAGDYSSTDHDAEFICIRLAFAPPLEKSRDEARAAGNAAVQHIGLRFRGKPEVGAFRADEDPDGWSWRKAFTQGPHHKSRARRRGKQGDRRRVRRAVRQALGGGNLTQPRGTSRMPAHHGRPYVAPEDLDAAVGRPDDETRSDDRA